MPAFPPDRVKLERLPLHAWGVMALLALTIVYALIQVGFVRPYLWPAGSGARLSHDPASRAPLLARPPDLRPEADRSATVIDVVDGGPAARAGISRGNVIAKISSGADRRGEPARLSETDPLEELIAWRRMYWLGVSGPVTWTIQSPSGRARDVVVDRTSAFGSIATGWARTHLGPLLQIVVFTGAAIALFVLRSHDHTAGVLVLALALSAIGSGGPLFGAEHVVPLGRVMTVLSWIAAPLAFPTIALAILHFPVRSALLSQHQWVHAVPFLVAAPMIVPASATALFLVGLDSAAPLALWDAQHPGVYYASFAGALALNLVVIGEGVYRFRFNHDANERRRIRMAVYTAVPGVIAFGLKDGVPVVADLVNVEPPTYPLFLLFLLQALVLLPAFGLTYAVGVARVLGPRVVLRRSLQYALASHTLTVVTLLPALALGISVLRQRDRTIREVATGSSMFYVTLIAGALYARRYRERAHQWLDVRFFREEYDARKVLLSLASRVRSETDSSELADLVVNQIDAALHPEMVAILVAGVEDGLLTPVAVLHGSAESLPVDSGLVSMLRWSDEPLEIFPQDPRSPARRLPLGEQEWLQCTGARLLVPVIDQDRSLIAAIALGERRSEEAYTAEDRQLLASIATQTGLGLDVARLRRKAERQAALERDTTRIVTPLSEPLMECPLCGRCEATGTPICPADGTAMQVVPSVPRSVDGKYRLEQLLGRGGMGAVYRARDLRLDRAVAVKVVRAELLEEPDAGLRFRREAQIIARLQHPAIVAIFDYGTFANGGAYLVMELVRGEDLRHVLQRERRLELHRAMRILETLCAAIEAAHREGILHRDLKPENILLPDGRDDAKVLDFGVAKVVSHDRRDAPGEAPTLVTAAGMIVGTPAYMAPEQFQMAEADRRTDIFSLGVIAYEMLSGELPFGRESLSEVILAQARGVPPMPPGTAPPAVERAIRSALEPDPDRRPASAQAFANLVQSALGM